MLFHLVRIAVLAAVLVACLFLPFLPGEFDRLAATLGTLAMLFGVVGILPAVVGACWIVYEIAKSQSGHASTPRGEYYFAVAAAICSIPVVGMLVIGAAVSSGISAAILTLVALGIYAVRSVLPQIRRLRLEGHPGFNSASLYLVALPLSVIVAWYLYGERMAETSRLRAIENATPMIADIEAYRARNGVYPATLFSEIGDYKPLIRGIERYHYETSGDGFNLIFEQFAFAFGTREFVAFNERDEQEVTAHDIDLLQVEPANLRRGYHASYDAGVPHWKVFLFD